MRLQIIEDDPISQKILVEMLGEHYHLSLYNNAGQGIEKIEKDRPALVLMDIYLPDMDGIEACKEIRQKSHTLPIVFISASDDPAKKEAGFLAGGQDYLTKPFEEKEIRARLAHHISLSRTIDELTSRTKKLEYDLKTVADSYMQREERLLDLKGIVHNLRNPIQSVMGLGDLIRQTTSDLIRDVQDSFTKENLTNVIELSEMIIKESSNLSAMVSDLVGGESQPLEIIDLSRIIRGELEIEELVIGRGIEKKLRLAEYHLPVRVLPVKISQVFRNLYENALQAVSTTKNPAIRIETFRVGRSACLSVEDNGPGISPEILPHIFLPRFSTKDGAGLGLFTCKRIAESFGGEIRVSKGREGKGSRFALLLPLAD